MEAGVEQEVEVDLVVEEVVVDHLIGVDLVVEVDLEEEEEGEAFVAEEDSKQQKNQKTKKINKNIKIWCNLHSHSTRAVCRYSKNLVTSSRSTSTTDPSKQ